MQSKIKRVEGCNSTIKYQGVQTIMKIFVKRYGVSIILCLLTLAFLTSRPTTPVASAASQAQNQSLPQGQSFQTINATFVIPVKQNRIYSTVEEDKIRFNWTAPAKYGGDATRWRQPT